MFFYEGFSCPVCGKPFRETDDIVSCPECGAPHHRECWRQEGHCHYAEDHGTERQWKRPTGYTDAPPTAAGAPAGEAAPGSEKICPHCGYANKEFAEFCSHCGWNLPSDDWSGVSTQYPPPYNTYPPGAGPIPPGGSYGEYSPYRMPVIDPYGGVPRDEKIEDVSVQDLVSVVGVNSPYYLPRFYRMSRGGSKAVWNWPAFLLPPFWLLYRKNYLAGAIALLLYTAGMFVQNYITYTYLSPIIADAQTYAAASRLLMEAMGDPRVRLYIIILCLTFVADLLLRILFGLLGNVIYLRTCISRVHKLAKDGGAYQQRLANAGGISLMMGAAAYAVLQLARMLIYLLVSTV